MNQNSNLDKFSIENDLFLLLAALSMIFCTEEDIFLKENDNAAQDDELCKEINDDQRQQNTLSVKSFVKDKAIEMYAKKGIEMVKKNLNKSEPLSVGSMDEEKIKDTDMDITFQLKNVKLYNLGSFQVKKFKSRSDRNMAEFAIAVPNVRSNADYIVNGTFKGKKVNGKGTADIKITGITIDNGKIEIRETPDEIQISSIEFVFDFKTLEVNQTGLNIEGFQSKDVNEFLNTSGQKYLKQNNRKLSNKVANELKQRANAKLRGKKKEELQELFK